MRKLNKLQGAGAVVSILAPAVSPYIHRRSLLYDFLFSSFPLDDLAFPSANPPSLRYLSAFLTTTCATLSYHLIQYIS